MKNWLLFAALFPCRLATAQSDPVSQPLAALPPLPETAFQPVVTTTTVSNTPGVLYQYQSVSFENARVFLAPAWHGQTKLKPSRDPFNLNGEADALLL